MNRFAITNTRVFDGRNVVGASVVVVEDETIAAVGYDVPDGAELIDGEGGTLLPGFIDAHTHSDEAALRTALRFGVTTELDLMSVPERMIPLREQARKKFDMADVRSSSWALTHPDGHPHQLRRGMNDPQWPTVTEPGDAAAFVAARIAEGADYIKVLIEDGTIFNTTMPIVSADIVAAVVNAAHDRGVMVLVHALSAPTTRTAIEAGADGLAHLLSDEIIAEDLVAHMVDHGQFVIPTLVVQASAAATGDGARLGADLRVAPRLDLEWIDNLDKQFDFDAPLQNAVQSTRLLHEAGVEVLVGTDAAHIGAPGLAHGVSLHDELRLLTLAGLSPAEALAAATRRTADRFSLDDRGRIEPGASADLVLVDGDPLSHLGATLNTRAVWRRGTRLAPADVTADHDA